MGAVVRPSAILFEQSKQTEPCESLKQAGNGLYRDCQSPNASEACTARKGRCRSAALLILTRKRGCLASASVLDQRAPDSGIRLAYASFVKRGLGRLVSAPRQLSFSPLRGCDGTCHRSSRFSQYQHLQGGNNGSYCWTRSHGPRDRPLNR